MEKNANIYNKLEQTNELQKQRKAFMRKLNH
jgi:hypothetical protein